MKQTEKVENRGEIQDLPFFQQKHACNRRNQLEIWVVLNSSPATSIKHQRVWNNDLQEDSSVTKAYCMTNNTFNSKILEQ